MPKTKTEYIKVLALLVVIALIGIAFIERQAIGDYIKLADYTPTKPISQLASDDTMTAYAKHLFYINHPQLDDKASFRNNCPNGTEQTVVLGCYHGGESGIFVLKVSDPQLNGVEQVTAAHETLHAAYDRLSGSEKTKVGGWLEAYFKTVTNKQLIDTINAYKKTEPHSLDNEMHSIFGTTITNLPPKLENYYKQYFTNRAKIVSYNANYRATFNKLKQQIASYDAQLKSLKSSITSDEASAKQQNASLEQQRQQMNQERASGNASAYNAGVDSYNASVQRYNALVQQIKAEINRYNQIIEARNKIAIDIDSLGSELNANAQTIQPAS